MKKYTYSKLVKAKCIRELHVWQQSQTTLDYVALKYHLKLLRLKVFTDFTGPSTAFVKTVKHSHVLLENFRLYSSIKITTCKVMYKVLDYIVRHFTHQANQITDTTSYHVQLLTPLSMEFASLLSQTG